MRHLRRREVRLPPVPPLTDTYIIPAGVHKIYNEISTQFDAVQIGREDHWVLGADVPQGGIRIFFTRKGVMESLRAVHNGKEITHIVQGDLEKAMDLLSSRSHRKIA